jgi:hypothetical protein
VYPADTVLDFFTYAGAPGTYNTDALGGGGGFVYSPRWAKGLTFSQSYVSAEGASFNNNAVTNASSGNPAYGGMFTDGAGSAAVTQLAYAGERTPMLGGNYGIALAYTYSQNLGLPTEPIRADSFCELGGRHRHLQHSERCPFRRRPVHRHDGCHDRLLVHRAAVDQRFGAWQ